MNRTFSWIASILHLRGECATNWENFGMAKKSGEPDVLKDAKAIIVGEELWYELQPQPTESTRTPYSSKNFGDPEIGTVIQWHLALCPICKPVIGGAPTPFGKRPPFCSEYFEIIEEYREYEGHYAMMGNP